MKELEVAHHGLLGDAGLGLGDEVGNIAARLRPGRFRLRISACLEGPAVPNALVGDLTVSTRDQLGDFGAAQLPRPRAEPRASREGTS